MNTSSLMPQTAAPGVPSEPGSPAFEKTAQSHFLALSTEIFAVIGFDGTLHHVNAAWHRALGSKVAAQDAVFADFVHPEDQKVTRAWMTALILSAQAEENAKENAKGNAKEDAKKDATGNVSESAQGNGLHSAAASVMEDYDMAGIACEVRLRHADGSYRWMVWQMAVRDGHIYGAARDITESREQEQAISDAHQKLTFYLVNSPLAVVEWNRNQEITYWSPEARQLFGWTADEIVARTADYSGFVYAQDRAAFCAALTGLVDEDAPRNHVQSRHRHKNGQTVVCEWYHAVLRDEYGETLSIFSLVLDITDRKKHEEELLKIRKAVESAGDAICILDIGAQAIHLNRAFTELFGYTLEEIKQAGIEALYRGEDAAYEARAAIGAGIPWSGEVELCSRGGVKTPVSMRADVIRDDQGSSIGLVIVYTDLRERRQAQQDLVHQALHDGLTGLPNRTFFSQRLARAFARGAEYRTRTAVMFFDLDNFKVINDSLGHEAGDHLLQVVAERLKACVRPEDMVARLGGDEFTVLLEGLAEEKDAVGVAERVYDQLRSPILLDGREVFATASIGIALARDTHENPEDLLRDADVAMYQAKTSGKAGYSFFNPQMNAEAMDRLELEMDLRHAIDRHEMEMYFQPIVHLESGRVTEVEALLRWNHPERGLINPVRFIPIAEETGLILPLGYWVLEESCRQARAWQDQYPSDPPLVMSVNLSTRQLQQDDLIESVAGVLERTGAPATSLKLEITESVMMLDSTAVLQKLHALKAMGIRLAVDDFGTGYSSMAYLSSLPIDTLKIDRAFISRLGVKSEDDAIVRAILSMAKMMRLHVTAEGIETPEQLSELNLLGCERGQGYLFAKPLTCENMETLLQHGQENPAAPPESVFMPPPEPISIPPQTRLPRAA